MKKPLLSIGMIVKNEIRCLERCLKSLEPLRQAIPCQLVIADTGSTDGTREIAEKYADVFFDFEWVNDFSAARNAVLDRCTGKWHLQLDADEWFEDCQPFINLMQAPKLNEYQFILPVLRNYRLLGNTEQYSDFSTARLFRLGIGIRYSGSIHEVPNYSNKKKNIKPSVIMVKDLIICHDGYADGVMAQDNRTKNQRNMELLRKEVDKYPNNLRVLCECIESGKEDPVEERGYADQGLKVIRSQEAEEMGYIYSLCRHGIRLYAVTGQMEKALEFWEEGCRYNSDSIHLRLDGAGYLMIGYYKSGQYEEAIKYGAIWRKAQSDYEADNYDAVEFIGGALMLCAPTQAAEMRAMLFDCLCHVEYWEEASEVLSHMRIEQVSLHNLALVADKLFAHGHHFPNIKTLLNNYWNHSKQSFCDSKKEEEWKRWRGMLLAKMEEAYRNDSPMWPAITTLDGDLGCSARALECKDTNKIPAMLEEIQDWGNVLPVIFCHVMKEEIPFPEGFYQSKGDTLASLSRGISVLPGMANLLLRYLEEFPPRSFPQLFWYQHLAADLLQRGCWNDDENLGRALCTAFAKLEQELLNQMYSPQMQEEKNQSILPQIHRFGIYVLEAMKAREQLQDLEYVQALHRALQEAEPMQKAVELMLNWRIIHPITPELFDLAAQVNAILLQYPADDPAVIALKQSEAYRKVAALLEQQAASEAVPQTVDDPPVSPAPLEEALVGSREEIAASIRKNIHRWGAPHAKARTDYWEKYPLWGKDEDEVVANLSAALSSHRADFRWLFDRLEDERSRRILTAVVRSWRFYEAEELGAVKETQYDDYFDLSILHCNENEVVADLGAYIGDTFLSYVKNYGSLAYRRYYAYEITKDSFDTLTKVTAPYPRVVLRRKGAGDGPGTMTLDVGADASANTLSTVENISKEKGVTETVELVALDDDIAEPLTLIKMDIEGAEQSALRGCARHIREDRPKLALSVYHNFEDLWKLPQMVEELAPGYRFYLRYHGGNLWPSEITLLALPE